MTFSTVSVLVPTRNRPDRLRTLLESFDRTYDGHAELVFRIDDDDVESPSVLFERSVVVGPRLRGYRSLPRFFNEMIQVAHGDVFVCGNDDMVFRTDGWDSLILNAANAYPDGVFDFGVRTHNETHYPFSIVSRKMTDALGFIWDERINWGDIYLRDVASAFGRAIMLPNVAIDHDWIGHAPDAVWLEGNQGDPALQSRAYWYGTHATAVGDAVDRLRGLVAA